MPNLREGIMRYKRLFLDGYDYFITVVTYDRNPILIDNIELLRESFKHAKTKFNFEIDAIVILPDHFHMIIKVDHSEEYPKIIGVIKSHFSKNCKPEFYAHLIQSESRTKQNYKPVWQKRFYEHTIRDDSDYKTRLDYIHFNPVKHQYVDTANMWVYSSLKKFIQKGVYSEDWCDFDHTIDFE